MEKCSEHLTDDFSIEKQKINHCFQILEKYPGKIKSEVKYMIVLDYRVPSVPDNIGLNIGALSCNLEKP
jgi:hypothetical protein